MASRLGIDIGGTHTDFLLLDRSTGRTCALKVPAIPGDITASVARGLDEIVRAAGIQPGEIETVVYSASAASCATSVHTGARIGLLITKGFEQVLHLARARTSAWPTGADDAGDQVAPVGLDLTRGIVERVSAKGNKLSQLDEAAARRSINELLQSGVGAMAICLIHAQANPAHELRLKAIVREMNENIPVVLSHEVAPEAGEYERALATVINTCLQPQTRRRLGALEASFKAAHVSPRIEVAQSAGGHASTRQVIEAPVHTLVAGRAGAATAAARIASQAGFPDALVLDIGGSSTDVSLIRGGMARVSNETAVSPDPIPVPSIDVRRAGAGGGSIARVSVAGVIRIGPDGAGADPGPACFGRGGKAATVTDANVVLGRLPAGRLSLDTEAAEEAVASFARELDLDRHRAAEGIVDIFNETVAGATRLTAIEKGEDPSRLALVACGGAGPMHACAVGALIGSAAVIVPRDAGVLSTLGFVLSDRSTQFAQAVSRSLDDLQPQQVEDIIGRLGAKAQAWLDEEGVAGTVNFRADIRYLRGHFQVSVEVDPAALSDASGLNSLADTLAEAHQHRFGLKLDQPVEIITLRAIVTAGADAVVPARFERGGADARAALIDDVQVYFDGGFISTSVFDRERLTAGNRIAGPALVLQSDTTTVIPPGHTGDVDEYLNILIRADHAASERQH